MDKNLIQDIDKDADKDLIVEDNSRIDSDEIHDAELAKGTDANLFTRREWIMRYASPFKALIFMAGPMVIIMIVNALYGIIDKQLALNYAIENVTHMFKDGTISGVVHDMGRNIIINQGNLNSVVDGVDIHEQAVLLAKQLINVSTQYSNTIITLLSAMSLFTSVGTAIKWGQAMGERNKERMDSIVVMGLIQTLLISVVGIVLLHYVAPFIIVSQADTPYSSREMSLIYQLSNSYTQMYIWGFPLLAFSTFISTLIRTEGKVWWVIVINLTAIALNIGCGEAFLKAAPAAQKMQSAVYGSFIAWAWSITIGLSVIAFSKNTLLRPNFKNVHLKIKDAGIIWLYGISPFIANFIFAVANYVITLLITIAHSGPELQNYIKVEFMSDTFYISDSLRAMSSAFPWMNILYAPLIGMMQGANANYAYCKGAGKRFRMIQIWRIHILINMSWGFVVLVIVAAAGGPMMEAFDGPANLKWWFFAYICGIPLAGMTYSALSLFQGIGDAFNSTMVAVLRSLVSNVGFVVIGWAIAKSLSTNGTGDWIIFLMNGLCEIPATILSMFIVYRYFRRMIKKYRVNDVVDDFDSPSLQQAAKNEVIIATQSLNRRALRIYNRDLSHVYKNHGYGSNEQQQVEQRYDLRLKMNEYRMKEKYLKAEQKFRFRNQPYGHGGRDRLYKQLLEWKEKMNWRLVESNSLTPIHDGEQIEKLYEKKFNAITNRIKKQNDYVNKIKDGEIKLTPLKLLIVDLAPQPLGEFNTAAVQPAKLKKHFKIRREKRKKIV